MRAINFNDGWTYRHPGDAGPGISVTLPHDAMLSEPRNERSAGGVNTGWFKGRDYLYEKHFTPGAELAGQKLVLEFEGVYRNAEVSLNGEKRMFRPYGYTNFYVDITDKAKIGEENVLEVIARNADQPNSRWYSGAGICRPVKLWTAPKEHIRMNGLRVRTVSTGPPTVEVTVLTRGSACPYNENGYLDTKTGTYYGEALAVVQAGEDGTIELTVSDGRHTGKAAVGISQNGR